MLHLGVCIQRPCGRFSKQMCSPGFSFYFCISHVSFAMDVFSFCVVFGFFGHCRAHSNSPLCIRGVLDAGREFCLFVVGVFELLPNVYRNIPETQIYPRHATHYTPYHAGPGPARDPSGPGRAGRPRRLVLCVCLVCLRYFFTCLHAYMFGIFVAYFFLSIPDWWT